MAYSGTGTNVFGGGTVDVWWASADTTCPSLPTASSRTNIFDNSDIPTTWTSIGAGFIDEDGFNVDFQNTINKVFVLASTAPQRVYRTQEEPMITFNLFESTIAGLGVATHGSSSTAIPNITTTPAAQAGGVTNSKRMYIYRGPVVRDAAILWRTISPASDDPDSDKWALQGYIPRGVFTQVGSFKYHKEQVTLPLTFEALASTTQTGVNQLGWIDVQGER